MLFPFVLVGLLLAVAASCLLVLEGAQILWCGLLLWLAGILAAMLVYTLVLLITGLFLPKDQFPEKNHRGFRTVTVFTMGLICRLFGIRIKISGLENMPQTGRFLLVSNHRSNFDPLVLGWALRSWEMAFVMKPDILKIPIAGPFTFQSGYIPMDRENNRAALKAILRAVELIKKDWVSIGIFPEGTRNRGEGLLEFRNGAFKIAQKANVPVVIARLDGTDLAPKRFPRPTTVCLEIRQVLDPEFVAAHSTAEIGNVVRQILQ